MSYWPANLDRSVSSPHWQAHLYTQLCAAAIQLNVLLRQLVYCNPNCVFSELNNGRGGRGKPEWFIRLGKCFLTASLLVSSCSTHNLCHVHTHVPAAAVQSVSCPHTRPSSGCTICVMSTHTHTHTRPSSGYTNLTPVSQLASIDRMRPSLENEHNYFWSTKETIYSFSNAARWPTKDHTPV